MGGRGSACCNPQHLESTTKQTCDCIDMTIFVGDFGDEDVGIVKQVTFFHSACCPWVA
jgi:hypothetical protein